MFPTVKLAGPSIDALLLYGCALGILLIIGIFIRLKVPLFKKYFIPSSLIAGTLGVIFGKYGFDLLPHAMIDTWENLPARLITVVFAPMLIGITIPDFRKLSHYVGPQVLFSYFQDLLQIAIPLFLSVFLFGPVWGINDLFALNVELGWSGGHGSAAGMMDVFKQYGFADGGPLGMTSATIGLIVGIMGGMVLINWGVRRGETTAIQSYDTLIQDVKDICPKSEQQPGSMVTINKDVVEPFAFHASLIAIAILLGWFAQKLIAKTFAISLPLFPLAMLGGLAVQIVISKTKWNEIVDKKTLQRLQGLALEFLIVAAIASMKIPVIVEYAVPLLIQHTIILIFTFSAFFLGRYFFKENWFEHSLAIFGTMTAMIAVGVMLIRTIDADNRTNVQQVYAMRSLFTGPMIGGGLVTSLMPLFVTSYGALKVAIVLTILSLLCIPIMKIFGWWVNPGSRGNINNHA